MKSSLLQYTVYMFIVGCTVHCTCDALGDLSVHAINPGLHMGPTSAAEIVMQITV